MTDLGDADLGGLLARLGSAYAGAQSSEAVLDSTVDLTADVLDADVSLIAGKDDAGLTPVATHPSGWDDEDGLLDPAAIPSVIASRDSAYLVADRGDVRGAAATEPVSALAPVRYRSLLVVPFSDDTVLVAGARKTGVFEERDLETLRLIGEFAATLADQVGSRPVETDARDLVNEAAAGLSHDANNFLTVIQGRLEMAREDPQSAHFDAIERAADRLGELIADTRTVLESGTHATEQAPVDLEAVVHEAWEVVGTDQSELVTARLGTIVADRSRLCQLFENLFRNAVEHAGPDVTVWVGMLPGSQGFYVEDDGPGIEPAERESVLEFAYSGSDGNTGVGLSIVKRIAAAHDWDISITRGGMGGTRLECSGVDIET